MFGFDPRHTSFNHQETTISRENVSGLKESWFNIHAGTISASPTVVNGRLYFGTWTGQFVASDAATGQVLWTQDVGVAGPPEMEQCFPSIGVAGQVYVYDDLVFVPGGDSFLYALKIDTGEVAWKLKLADTSAGAHLWSSFTRAGDYLYLGIASLGDCPLTRGALARIDLRDPQNPTFKYLMPENEVGAGIWSTPAVDEETDTIYATTGTGEFNADNKQWGGALLAIEGKTLDIRAHYMLPTLDNEGDIEWGSSPTVVRTPSGRKIVVATGKDGILYALQASDLSLVYTVRLAIQCICPECGCGSVSTPAYDGRYLYVGAGVSDPDLFEDGSIYALDPDTGNIAWGGPIFGTIIAPVTVANGLVYASTMDGLKIFNSDTGEMVFADEGRGGLFSQPVVTGGNVYCTFFRGYSSAYHIDEEAVAPPPEETASSRNR